MPFLPYFEGTPRHHVFLNCRGARIEDGAAHVVWYLRCGMRACCATDSRPCGAPQEVQAPVASCVCVGLASVRDGRFWNTRDGVKACLQQVPHNRPACRVAVRHGRLNFIRSEA